MYPLWQSVEDRNTSKIEEYLLKKIAGQEKTIRRLGEEKATLQKENHRLRRDLGILEEEGSLETPSFPLIKVGAGFRGRPIGEPEVDQGRV